MISAFSQEKRGYAMREVDEYIDRLREEYDKSAKMCKQLQAKVNELEGSRSDAEDVARALIAAETFARKTEERAEAKAKQLVEEAEAAAYQIVSEAQAKVQGAAESAESKAKQIVAEAEEITGRVIKDASARAQSLVAAAEAKARQLLGQAEERHSVINDGLRSVYKTLLTMLSEDAGQEEANDDAGQTPDGDGPDTAPGENIFLLDPEEFADKTG